MKNLETQRLADLEMNLETDLENWQSDRKRGHTVFKFLWGQVVQGLKEGLLYLEKYGISGPEFGIKEEFVTERGRQLFHACAWTACCLQLGQLTGANERLRADCLPWRCAVALGVLGAFYLFRLLTL